MNPTIEQLEKINLYTRRELSADEVFVFSVILCDNEIDRDYERFTYDSLEILAELFIGKTGVFDHNPNAQNQAARIFATELIQDGKTSLEDDYYSLQAWAYMVRCNKNADLISEIDAGIKKEVSVGCAVEQVVCSICGKNMKTDICSHEKGKLYPDSIYGDGNNVCFHNLVNPTDAYEWSFVAVPNMRKAPQKERKCSMKKYLIIDTNGDDKIHETENVNKAIYEHYTYTHSADETVKDAIMAMQSVEKAVNLHNKFTQSDCDENEIVLIVDVENALYSRK